MRSNWVRIGWVVLFLSIAVGSAAMASSIFGTSYDLGEEIQFKVEDSTIWLWGCCSCADSLVLGWRIANASGQVVYSVIHDAPVSSAIWQGSWLQFDMNGSAVVAGQYKLYVDTSAGTLSRNITIGVPTRVVGATRHAHLVLVRTSPRSPIVRVAHRLCSLRTAKHKRDVSRSSGGVAPVLLAVAPAVLAVRS